VGASDSKAIATSVTPNRLTGHDSRARCSFDHRHFAFTGTRVAEIRSGAGKRPVRKESVVAKTIVGLFENRVQAQQLVQQLRALNIAGEDISVMSRGDSADDSAGGDRASGVAIGAGAGAALGGLGGLLVGLGALAIPGIGPVLAAGPIAAALAGAGLGAAAGGVIGALTELGIPEEDAHVWAEGVRRGGTLVTVHADDEMADEIMALMARHGAIDVDEHATRWRQAGWPGFDPAAGPLGVDDGLRIGVLRTDAAVGAMETEAKVGQPVKEPGVYGGIRGSGRSRGARAYHYPAGRPFRRSDAA
jgi:hypothetical protein